MKEKLLHKTLRIYLFFSFAVLLVTAPAFYYFTGYWHVSEADEALLLRQHEFEKFQLPGFRITDINVWNRWTRDVKIEPENINIKAPQFTVSEFPNVMENEMEPYRVLRAPIVIEGEIYTFFAKENLLESKDMLYNIVALYVPIMLLLLIGVYFFTKRLSLFLWQPFYRLLDELEKFEIDKSAGVHLPETTIDEFHRLNVVTEKLISRNLAIFKNQKEFIENAAHELQTPLAVIQAKLDNLMQTQNISGQQAAGLETLNNALGRLSRLNKNLLLLSRLDYDAYAEKQTILIKPLLDQQIDFLSEQAAMEGIQINVNLNENAHVICNNVLLEILLSNLLTNAMKHNKKDGIIHISSTDRTFVIENTGTLAPLDRDKLFSRFSKGNSSAQGTGLGLAIIKKIADLNDWEITYAYQNNLHIFSVAF